MLLLLLRLATAANDNNEDVDDGRFFSVAAAEEERRPPPPARAGVYASDAYDDDDDDATTEPIVVDDDTTTTTTPILATTRAATTTTATTAAPAAVGTSSFNPPYATTTTRRPTLTVATGVVASVYAPPLVLGTPPPEVTVVYDVPTKGGGFSVRVPAGAWLWDDRRRSTPPELSVTILELPTPFFLPDSGILAVSPLAIALGPSGRRPRAPLQVRLPSANGDYYQLSPNGTAATRCGDAGGWASVSPLGVVFVGTPLLIPLVSTPPTPRSTPPPPLPSATSSEQEVLLMPSAEKQDPATNQPLVGALAAAIGGVVCLWGGLRVWRTRQLRRINDAKSSSSSSSLTSSVDLVHVM